MQRNELKIENPSTTLKLSHRMCEQLSTQIYLYQDEADDPSADTFL